MFEDVLVEVAAATNLEEGPEGVRLVLRLAGQQRRTGIRTLSRRARLPVPVAAAVRRELERRGLLDRDGGIVLTERGRKLLAEAGVTGGPSFACPQCAGRRVVATPSLEPVLRVLDDACRGRPAVDLRLDQSHATAETSLHRALYMHEYDALSGRRILVVGDDDLLSLALACLGRHLRARAEIVAVDVDARVLDHIHAVCQREGLAGVTTRHLDLRCSPPPELTGAFDVFATDPPYTAEGLRLFASRGAQALAPGTGRQGFVSFAHRSPQDMLRLCGDLVGMGLCPTEIVPDFNGYEGAQVLAGTSQMLRLVTAGRLRPAWEMTCDAPIYTAQVARGGEAGR